VTFELGAIRTDITNQIQTISGLTPNTCFSNFRISQIRGLMTGLDVAACMA
jgi:hypothetical protein